MLPPSPLGPCQRLHADSSPSPPSPRQDLANGYMSGKLLLKLDAIGFLLAHHTAEFYSFLDHPTNTRNR